MNPLTLLRNAGALLCWTALAAPVLAANIRGELTLKDNQTQFRSGEPIRLRLNIEADTSGYSVMNSPTDLPHAHLDKVVVTPTQGVYPWSADQERFDDYRNDLFGFTELIPGKPFKLAIRLNNYFRFDSPGRYTVHITTRRVRAVDPSSHDPRRFDSPPVEVTSNDVSFEVLPMSPDDEARLAASLERRIRDATDAGTAQAIIVNDLEDLTGDAATAVKLSLYLKPQIIHGMTTNAATGLWIARNRGMVVSALERAIVDPDQISTVNMDLLDTLVSLKSSMARPYDPTQPEASDDEDQLSTEYVHQIAGTIPQRKGEPGIDAARVVFDWMARHDKASGPDFEGAREYLIAHFADVDPYNVDWLLNDHGKYLRDRRMVAVLQHLVDDSHDPMFQPTRDAALKQLAAIAPEDARVKGSRVPQE
jgi:hypothetical protein